MRLDLAFLLSSLVCACSAQTNIQIVAFTNSADFQVGRPQGGGLASIFCTGLQGTTGITQADSYPSLSLAGVVAQFGYVYANETRTVMASILAVDFEKGYQQINVQVPWELYDSPYYVEVFQDGQHSITDNIGATEWSVFFVDTTGHALVQHAADYSPVTARNPARPGEYLIAYGTNLGPVLNQPQTGYPAQLTPLSPTSLPQGTSCGPVSQLVLLTNAIAPVRNFVASVLFSGLTPGTVGVYQVNFQVPPSISGGDWSILFEQTYTGGIFGLCTYGYYYTDDEKSRSALLPVQEQ